MEKVEYLHFHELMEICFAIIPGAQIRDGGLLKSAAERPKTMLFGEDAYKSFNEKASALMHSLARNHPLIAGNKELAWAATRAFCLMNNCDILMKIDDAEQLVLKAAVGEYGVPEIVSQLKIVELESN